MEQPFAARRCAPHLTRRELLTAGLAAGATFALRPLARPPLLWGGDTGQPKRVTTSWQPYVKNFAPNHSFDYGNRAAALWLDR